MELGLYTFGDITADPQTGRTVTVSERYAEIVAAAKLADEAGLAVFGVGEHHRLDVAIASPAVVMAAIAGVTKRIRLTSAVTVLSTLDPVRVYQDFATVDLLSGGRAEIIAGRGAYIESFPLFGAAIDDYDALFAEKLDLLLQIDRSDRVTWDGRFRSALKDVEISPRPLNRLPVWLGVGGTADSARRAADHGLPIVLANISQPPANFAGQIVEYRERHAAAGHDPQQRRVAVATHCYVAPQSQVLSLLPRLFLLAHRAVLLLARGTARSLRDACRAARANLCRQSARDHRQARLRAHTLRPGPFPRADRYRRPAL
jgi:alkanesulfonate monooxygenase SsuD/methylene tetrahydromethanopterin reductase-like flavin-dependent oxidoreductase (luciferase family)